MIARVAPRLATSRSELAEALETLGSPKATVALVPTMGALHAGHAALLREARSCADVLVMSVFVNPLQFGPGEDFADYPRSFDADQAVAAAEGVDLVFTPDDQAMYPHGEPQVSVDPGQLGSQLEGTVRPTHFRGVLTVVAVLFELVRPCVAVFGEKDYQQLVLLRQMSSDLALGVDVRGVATVRDSDGLALSSRNRRLDPVRRAQALALPMALQAGAAAAERGAAAVLAAASAVLNRAEGLSLDYLELTDPKLGRAPTRGTARLLVAGRVGGTRLIDNVALCLGYPTSGEAH